MFCYVQITRSFLQSSPTPQEAPNTQILRERRNKHWTDFQIYPILFCCLDVLRLHFDFIEARWRVKCQGKSLAYALSVSTEMSSFRLARGEPISREFWRTYPNLTCLPPYMGLSPGHLTPEVPYRGGKVAFVLVFFCEVSHTNLALIHTEDFILSIISAICHCHAQLYYSPRRVFLRAAKISAE